MACSPVWHRRERQSVFPIILSTRRPWSGLLPGKKPEATVEAFACQHGHEDDSLQHQYGGIGEPKPPLQKSAACTDAAEQDRNRNDGKRVMPRQKRHQNSRESITYGEIGIGPALNGRHLDHAGKARSGATEKAR